MTAVRNERLIMESYEVLRQAFKPLGCKNVAAELKLSRSLIYQWSRGKQGKSEAFNPLDRVAQLVELGGEELLNWLCRRRGGRFVPADKLPAHAGRCWEQMKAEMEKLIKAGQTKKRMGDGSWQLGVGGKPNLPSAVSQFPTPDSQLPGSRASGGSRCKHRLPGGRCGFAAGR